MQEGICHAGTKASKVVFLGSSGRLLTTGFSRHSDRQYAIWSQHDLTVPLTCETIDSSSGVVFPFYDNDTNMVFLAGKVRTSYVHTKENETKEIHIFAALLPRVIRIASFLFSLRRVMVIFVTTRQLTKLPGCIISVNLYLGILKEDWE